MLLLGPPWRPLGSGVRVDIQIPLARARRRSIAPLATFATVLASLLLALAFALVARACALVVLLLPRRTAV
jgi:hypothetical protein